MCEAYNSGTILGKRTRANFNNFGIVPAKLLEEAMIPHRIIAFLGNYQRLKPKSELKPIPMLDFKYKERFRNTRYGQIRGQKSQRTIWSKKVAHGHNDISIFMTKSSCEVKYWATISHFSSEFTQWWRKHLHRFAFRRVVAGLCFDGTMMLKIRNTLRESLKLPAWVLHGQIFIIARAETLSMFESPKISNKYLLWYLSKLLQSNNRLKILIHAIHLAIRFCSFSFDLTAVNPFPLICARLDIEYVLLSISYSNDCNDSLFLPKRLMHHRFCFITLSASKPDRYSDLTSVRVSWEIVTKRLALDPLNISLDPIWRIFHGIGSVIQNLGSRVVFPVFVPTLWGSLRNQEFGPYAYLSSV